MPQKRKHGGGDSVGVGAEGRTHESARRRRAKRSKALDKQERVPRELTRLLSYANGVKPRSGLDDGDGATAKQAKPKKPRAEPMSTEPKNAEAPKPSLKILPGERIGDYSARVDAALPVAGLLKKGKTADVPGARPYQTKLERRMQRMQKEWRLEDVKIKAEREEAAQELEDQLDELLPGVGARHSAWGSKSGEDDPWAAIDRSRKAKTETSRGLVGVHDVVQAPPQLKLGKPKLKEPGKRVPQTARKRR